MTPSPFRSEAYKLQHRAHGITGVPNFTINGQYVLSGAQVGSGCSLPAPWPLLLSGTPLRVNLPRQVMSFSDFPFIPEAMPGRSKDARWYPHHAEVQAWLERFAETFGLLDVIQFRRRVVWAEPAWEGEA